MRKFAKKDSNQRDVELALKRVGASVQDLSIVGGGCVDLLVGYRGMSYCLEVKDGAKPPSARKLTDDEFLWHVKWNGHKAVVCSAADALKEIGAI